MITVKDDLVESAKIKLRSSQNLTSKAKTLIITIEYTFRSIGKFSNYILFKATYSFILQFHIE